MEGNQTIMPISNEVISPYIDVEWPGTSTDYVGRKQQREQLSMSGSNFLHAFPALSEWRHIVHEPTPLPARYDRTPQETEPLGFTYLGTYVCTSCRYGLHTCIQNA